MHRGRAGVPCSADLPARVGPAGSGTGVSIYAGGRGVRGTRPSVPTKLRWPVRPTPPAAVVPAPVRARRNPQPTPLLRRPGVRLGGLLPATRGDLSLTELPAV